MGPMTNKVDPLREYARSGSAEAFGRFWSRHVAGVRAACRRRLRDPAAVEDAVQRVFVTAARRAGSIPAAAVLAGWLRRTAAHQARRDARAADTRQRHERQWSPPHNADAAERADLADAVARILSRLPPGDRAALTMRYLDGWSLAEVARATGTTEGAARKRVTRALGRLRRLFPAGPPALSFTAGSKWTPLRKVLIMTAKQKLLTAAAVAVVVGGATAVLVTTGGRVPAGPPPQPSVAASAADATSPAVAPSPPPVVPPSVAATPDDWQGAIDRAYALGTGEVLRQVLPPLIPERQPFLDAQTVQGGGGALSADHWRITVAWDGGHAVRWDAGTLGELPLRTVLSSCVGLTAADLDEASMPLDLTLGGDIVYRPDAPAAAKLAALGPIVSGELGRPVHFERRTVEVPILTVTGHYRFAPLEPAAQDGVIQLLGRPIDLGVPDPQGGTLGKALAKVAAALHARLDDRTGEGGRSIRYCDRIVAGSPEQGMRVGETDAPQRLLANVAGQTGLTFTRGTRSGLAWCLDEGDGPTSRPAPAGR